MNRMRRTSLLWIVGVTAVGLIVGRLTPPVIVRFGGAVPRVSWLAAALVAFAAVVMGVLAWNTWQNLHRKNRRMTSQYGITMVSLAKSGAAVATLVGGFYAGFALAYLDALDVALGRERALHSGVAAGACLILLITSLLLERACIAPDDGEDEAVADSA